MQCLLGVWTWLPYGMFAGSVDLTLTLNVFRWCGQRVARWAVRTLRAIR